MVLLGDEAQVEARFSPFKDSANLVARYVHDLRRMYHWLRNHFGRTRWYSYVTRLKWMLVLFRLEIVLILTQDRCTVCTEHTIGSEIIFRRTWWNSLVAWFMWNLISVHLDTMLVSVEDGCMVCAKRAIGSEIVLDAPDGTPRWRGSSGCSLRFVWI
jgi:hypothetical protein